MWEECIDACLNLWMNRQCIYVYMDFGIQYMYCKSISSPLVSIPKELRTNWSLSSTSDAEKSMRLYVGFPGSDLSPSSSVNMLTLYKDPTFRSRIPLVLSQFCFRQIYSCWMLCLWGLWQNSNGSLTKSGSLKIDSCLVLTECFGRQILRFRTSVIGLIHSKRVSTSTSSFFANRMASMIMPKIWC